MIDEKELAAAVNTLQGYCSSKINCIKNCKFYIGTDERGECSLSGRIPSEWEYPVPKFKLSNIEIQLLKLCKSLGYDSIEKREHLGSIFVLAFDSREYRTWRLPEEWEADNALFKGMEMNQPVKIDDILAES